MGAVTFKRTRAPETAVYLKAPGGTPLYKPCWYVLPLKVGFLLPFGLKKAYRLGPFLSDIGYRFQRNHGSV